MSLCIFHSYVSFNHKNYTCCGGLWKFPYKQENVHVRANYMIYTVTCSFHQVFKNKEKIKKASSRSGWKVASKGDIPTGYFCKQNNFPQLLSLHSGNQLVVKIVSHRRREVWCIVISKKMIIRERVKHSPPPPHTLKFAAFHTCISFKNNRAIVCEV